MFKIAIIGRPNVGKSTLFNQLTRTRNALVHDRPGVTRDMIVGDLVLSDIEAEVVDTAGIDLNAKVGAVDKAMSDLAISALNIADVCLMIVDGKYGLNPDDKKLAKIIQKTKKPTLLLVNKTESKKGMENFYDFYSLGLGEPVAISAEHREGFAEIASWLKKLAEKYNDNESEKSENKKIRLSIVGQPNVGKSTLTNTLLGETRVLVHDEPGITRDTILIPFNYSGTDFILADTAGIRKKNKVNDDVETLSSIKAINAINESDIVILVIDATLGIEKQDLTLSGRICEEGRILVIAINKWDLIKKEEQDNLLRDIQKKFNQNFFQIQEPAIIPISALNTFGIKRLMKKLIDLWNKTNTRISTSALNRFLDKLISETPAPLSKMKKPVKIKFAAQSEIRPITFTLTISGGGEYPDSYERFIKNNIAKKFSLENLVVRINYKKTENPFADK